MVTATVTTRGIGQSVQLPEGFQLDAGEVYVKRVGRSVLLIPKDANPWEVFEESLDLVTDDFLRERNQPPEQLREAMFEEPIRYFTDVIRSAEITTSSSFPGVPSPSNTVPFRTMMSALARERRSSDHGDGRR